MREKREGERDCRLLLSFLYPISFLGLVFFWHCCSTSRPCFAWVSMALVLYQGCFFLLLLQFSDHPLLVVVVVRALHLLRLPAQTAFFVLRHELGHDTHGYQEEPRDVLLRQGLGEDQVGQQQRHRLPRRRHLQNATWF